MAARTTGLCHPAGSEVANAYLETSEGWSPDRLVFGEWDSTNNKSINLCPMLWYGAKMQESTAKNTSQMTSDLKELEMLFDREVVTRPG